jgi:hypothetical protein
LDVTRIFCAETSERWSWSAARVDAGLAVGTDVDGEVVGVGDPVPDVLADGLGDVDELGDGEVVVGVGLDDCVGLALGDPLADGEPAAQLGVIRGGKLWSGPLAPGLRWWCELWWVCPGPVLLLEPPGPYPRVLLVGATACGSAAIAQDAPITTSNPVAMAAAGRNHPSHPALPRSGRNRSATAPAP